MIPILEPNALIYIPYPRVNCLKTIPFTAAHTYIAHIWQYPPGTVWQFLPWDAGIFAARQSNEWTSEHFLFWIS